MANGVLRAYLDTAGGTILVGNPNFYLDGFPVAVEGNPVQSHGDSPHNNAVMVAGSPNFVVNGIPVCTTTSQASCGHFATSSSSFGVGSGARGTSTKTPQNSSVYANSISSLGATTAATRATPVWAAYFGATDNGTLTDNQPPVPFYATESYGDVNKYEYVKPMISIMGTRGNLGYSYDTVDQMFASTRYQAIPEKIKALPQGKRAVRLYRYDQGPIYEDIRDRYPSGTDAWSGSQILWAENAGISVSNELTRVISDLKLKGCQPDYVIGDMPPGEYLPFGFFDNANWSKILPGITNDLRSNAPWYNSPSFNNLYTVNGKYGLSFDDIKNRVFHPQLNKQYSYWNRAVFGIETEFLNQFVYNTLKQQWGVTKFSNFNSVVAGETADLYDPNGHTPIYASYAGDAISPALYAGWNFPNVYGISQTDTTRIIRTNAGPTVSGITADAWSQFLLLLTNIRIAKNESPTVPIRPWVVSPEWTQGGAAFNPKWITDTSIGETIGRKLYWENIRHIILIGSEMLHIWDGGNDTTGKTNNFLSTMNTIIRDINDRTGGFRIHSLNKTRIDFLASYVVSGSPTVNNTYVWRVTPKPGVILIGEQGRPLLVDDYGGAWLETSTPSIPSYSVSV